MAKENTKENNNNIQNLFMAENSDKYKAAVNSLGKNLTALNEYSKFNKLKVHENVDFLTSNVGYIFMTKPQIDPDYKNSLINALKDSDVLGIILGNLVKGQQPPSPANFIPFITNAAEGFEFKDTVINTDTKYENLKGQKMVMPTNKFESETADTFSLTFNEYENRLITAFHKIWVDYIHDISYGSFRKKNIKDVFTRILDYAVSLYAFYLGVDGRTIKTFSKYTGLYPTNVPYSAFSFNLTDRGFKKISVTYQYTFKEDMDLLILEDFNEISTGSRSIENKSTVNNYKYNKLNKNYSSTPMVIKNNKTGELELVFY